MKRTLLIAAALVTFAAPAALAEHRDYDSPKRVKVLAHQLERATDELLYSAKRFGIGRYGDRAAFHAIVRLQREADDLKRAARHRYRPGRVYPAIDSVLRAYQHADYMLNRRNVRPLVQMRFNQVSRIVHRLERTVPVRRAWNRRGDRWRGYDNDRVGGTCDLQTPKHHKRSKPRAYARR